MSGGIEAAARRMRSVTRVAVEIVGPGGRTTSLVHFNDASVDFLPLPLTQRLQLAPSGTSMNIAEQRRFYWHLNVGGREKKKD